MTKPYASIIGHRDQDWASFLEDLCLTEIFKPVMNSYTEQDTLTCVIKYIVFAYSLESDKITLGLDWQKNKQNIYEYVLAKPIKSLYEDLVLLKNESVLDSIHRWLDFQDNDTHKQLSVLKDLRVEMQLSAVSPIMKSGSIDFDQKFKNAEYANKLKLMIKDLESELIQNSSSLKEAFREVKAEKNNTKNSRSVGSFAVR